MSYSFTIEPSTSKNKKLKVVIYKDNKKEYWILNPHIAFKGKTGDESIYKQFDGTQIQKYLHVL